MSKKEYTKEQLEILRINKYIKNCSPKSISFTSEFKQKTIELDTLWKYSRDIFIEFWFPDFIVNSDVPRQSLKNWRLIMKRNWLIRLAEGKRWRKKKNKVNLSKMTKEEELKFFKAKSAYLEEENRILKWLKKNDVP